MLPLDRIAELSELLTKLWTTCSENTETRIGNSSSDVGVQRYALKLLDKLPILPNLLEIQNERCIFVYEPNSNSILSSMQGEGSATIRSESIAVNNEELELTGCPLECPFNLSDSAFDQSMSYINGKTCDALEQLKSGYNPLNIRIASGLISLFRETSKQVQQSENIKKWALASFIVFCDGHDAENTVLLGIQKTGDGTKTFRVKCRDSAIPVNEIPVFDTWKKDHLLEISHSVVETEASAQFDIVELSFDEVSKTDARSNIMLECEWKNVHHLLEMPSATALCTVHFNVVLSDQQSSISSRWKELQILEELMQHLSDNIAWTTMQAETSVLKEVTDLIDEMTLDRNRKRVMRRVKGKSLETSFMDELLKDSRENLDFTDKLWTVLKNCGSRSELSKCLNLVLHRVESREVNPVIFSMNKTRLGALITDVQKRKAEIPCLDLLNLEKLLIEIGIEKLKQDYISVFLMSGLVSKENLNPIIGTINEASGNSLHSLYKLHCVLQLIVLCKRCVNAPDTLLGTYARLALSQLSSGSFDSKSHQFSFQIDRQTVQELLLKHSPKKWQVSLKSSQNTYKVQTIIFLSTEAPLRMGFLQHNHTEPSDGDGLRYYCCTSTTVQDAF